MATFGQIAHAIRDFSKTISDDSVINIDHIIFLMSKYRNYLLSQPKKKLTEADYQTICVNVTVGKDGDICGSTPYLVSTDVIPTVMARGGVTVAPPAGFLHGYRFQFVPFQQFQFVGFNKWLYGFIYVTIGPDGRLYVKSHNGGFRYLEKLRLTALFDDIEKAAELECDDCCNLEVCDIEEREFPLDAGYLPLLMKYCTVEITGAAWNPRDDENNATDDLATLAQILNRYTNTAFKRKLTGNQEDATT